MRVKQVWMWMVGCLVFIGCSGHQLTPEGMKIDQAYNLSDVQNCKKIGESTAEVAQNLRWQAGFTGGLGGKQARDNMNPKEKNDMITDARNKTAQMGGNRFIMLGEAYGAEWQFAAYQCDL
ncbi:hypothetical protein WDW89_00400 [Deltaproteobacteria bacterium TL4]